MKSETTVGTLLTAARTSRQMSQEEVASAAKIGRNYYSRVETNQHTPKLNTLVDIKNGLRLTHAEWRDVLARYLVDAGAATEEEAGKMFTEANRIKSSDDEFHAAQFSRCVNVLKELGAEERSIAVELLEFMRDFPAFFPAMKSLMEVNRNRAADVDFTEETPSGPRMVVAEAKVYDRRATERPTSDTVPERSSPEATGGHREPRGQPVDPVMKKLLKKKSAEKAAKS